MKNDARENDELLTAKVDDAFIKASGYCEKFIGFLDPHEAVTAKKRADFLMKNSEYRDCDFELFGGYNEAERVFLGVFPPYSDSKERVFPITALEITFRFANLAHRDFLGALLGLGIVKSKIGDIIVSDTKCTVFVEKTVCPFIMQNLTKVGSAGVECKIIDGSTVVRNDHFKELTSTIASSRLDCVVAAITNSSRSQACTLIESGLVSVGYEVCCDNTYFIQESTTVSIRGHGRFAVDKPGPETRKGRLVFKARKYI